MRRIDLISNILAPVLTGFIMAFSTRWISAIFIAGWNVVSLVVELILYTKVYRLAGETLSNKVSKNTSGQGKSMPRRDLVPSNEEIVLEPEKKSGLSK